MAYIQKCLQETPGDRNYLNAWNDLHPQTGRSRPYRAHGECAYEPAETLSHTRGEFVNAMIRAAHAKYQGQVPSLYEQWALFTENNLPPMSELEVAIDDEVRLPHRLSIVSRHFVLTT